ncbi:acyl-CoA desaturase [Paraflavisolibacter sp. H34]|uniref:fatty acid desaturase family protein n=1 Tax=Huijunlia imazamoxiresistens TaxID=3127457 RepID=UPI003017341C
MAKKLKFTNTRQSQFYATLKQRVDAYFHQNALSKYGNRSLWAKALFFLTGYIALYGLLLSGLFGAPVMALLAALLGAFGACIGFNICHDAIHGAFSANRHVNKAFSLLFHFIGANPYVWNITHNIVHHSYTNIAGHDGDLDMAPGLIRLSVTEKMLPHQRYQHLYAFGLYAVAMLNWVFRKDFEKFFQKEIGGHRSGRHPKKEYFNLFFYKAVYYVLFIVLPLMVVPLPWWQVLTGFLLLQLVQGLVSGLVFSVTHVVEDTAFPEPNAQGNMEESWAEHQVRTSSNFAGDSSLATFLCGGLNLQTAHHLFPKICHIHYPALNPIIRETAREFHLPYIEYPTFGAALRSHYRMLRKLGREAEPEGAPDACAVFARVQISPNFKIDSEN